MLVGFNVIVNVLFFVGGGFVFIVVGIFGGLGVLKFNFGLF